MPFTFLRRILDGWQSWLTARAERRARAAAARAIAVEIEKVRAQRQRAEHQHRSVRAIDTRLRNLVNRQLLNELGIQ
jgi:hypothetical protein